LLLITSRFVRSILGVVFVGVITLCASNARADFRCGPNLVTYQVQDANGSTANGTGVRCVKFVVFGSYAGDLTGQYAFSWYGEGYWGGTRYRNLGRAMWLPTNGGISFWLDVKTADFYGNGESTAGRTDGTVQVSYSPEYPPNNIRLSGAWNEKWVRRTDGVVWGYNGMQRVLHCGPYMVQYSVETQSDVSISGIRCQLESDVGIGPLIYFADGMFDGSHHFSLGVKRVFTQNNKTYRRVTMVDICNDTGLCRDYGWNIGDVPAGLCYFGSLSYDGACAGDDVEGYSVPYFHEFWSWSALVPNPGTI
jgi:hypothetical protein